MNNNPDKSPAEKLPVNNQIQHFIHGFHAHPASADQTYLQHLVFAAGFSANLFGLSLAALLHALVPPLCSTTVSRHIDRLHKRMHQQVNAHDCG